MKIKVKYSEGVEEIRQMHCGEWYDLRAAEDTMIRYHEFGKIPLGVAIELPEGYEAHVVPRSSTFLKYGIFMTNSFGVIDHAYCGDNDIWQFPAYCLEGRNHKDGQYGAFIPKNARIAQFRIVKQQPSAEVVTVDHLQGKDRGGFGSTGEA